jgi:hypothetical protein
MNLELKKVVIEKLVTEKLELIHKSSPTLSILYDAIENCSNQDFLYHRDIVFEMFNDNDNLVKQENGKWFYAFTKIPFDLDLDKTNLDILLEDLLSEDCYAECDLSESKIIEEICEWTEMVYNRFVFFFFTLCLKRLDELNHEIDWDLH